MLGAKELVSKRGRVFACKDLTFELMKTNTVAVTITGGDNGSDGVSGELGGVCQEKIWGKSIPSTGQSPERESHLGVFGKQTEVQQSWMCRAQGRKF